MNLHTHSLYKLPITQNMIIYTDKISTIEYDEESQNITYLGRGFANKDLFIDQLKAVIEFSKTSKVTSTIADLRRLQGSFKNIFDYLHNEYYPALKSQGLKCKAFIISEDIISTYLTNELVKDLNKRGIDAAIFSTTKAAGQWVQQHRQNHKQAS